MPRITRYAPEVRVRTVRMFFRSSRGLFVAVGDDDCRGVEVGDDA